jgi:hypothetical protein
VGTASIFVRLRFAYIANACFFIRRECIIGVASLPTYHQFKFREFLGWQDLLLVDTLPVRIFLSLFIEALAVEALVSTSVTYVIRISPRVLREVVDSGSCLQHVIAR